MPFAFRSQLRCDEARFRRVGFVAIWRQGCCAGKNRGMTAPVARAAWHPESLAGRLPFLRRRAALTRAVRGFFLDRGYLEVETPYAVPAPGEEVHLRAFETARHHPDGTTERLWLHTSPEFAMKRLLVAGAGSIFQFARVWRNGEGSALHAPEFTMLEWYRPGAGMDALIEEVSSLLRSVLPPVVCCRGVTSDLSRFERLTVAEAFARYAGVDLLAIGEDAGGLAAASGVRLREGETWEDLFFRLLLERVEPRLGRRASDVSDALAGGAGGFGAPGPGGSSGGGAVRAVRLWHRTGERVRRVD